MQIAARTAAWAKSGNNARPYLDITGNVYVDTNYHLPQNMSSIESEVKCIVNRDNANGCLFYIRNESDHSTSYILMFYFTSVKSFWYGYGSQILGNYNWNTGVEYSVVANSSGLFLNGDKVCSVGSTFPVYSGANAILFSFSKTGSYFNGRWYGHKLKVNEELVRDWRPFVDNNGVACVKDFITGELLYKVGTGTITYGEEAA